MSEATKEPSRFGGECYEISCPFHTIHFTVYEPNFKGEEPLCNAESIKLTEEEFQTKAVCRQGRG